MDEKGKSSDIRSFGGDSVRGVEHPAAAAREKNGLNVAKASFFMIAQMAGAGFLALPRAMADAGWIGLVLVILFCVSTCFSATRIGKSWVILEERYEEYRNPTRKPYLEIAYRAFGTAGRRFALVLMMANNIGSSTVFLIVMSELVNSVFNQLSMCEYALIVGAVLTPFAWLGTPKDFWQASVFAVVSTLLAIIIIVMKIFLDYQADPVYPLPTHPNPNISSFSLGFGAILYAYGGMSVFPTIQNDMKDRTQFWKSAVIAFAAIWLMYFPVALFGYIYIGDSVDSNVILSLESSPVLSAAILFEIFNLLGTFIITLSPVFQLLEDIFDVPHHFGIKRVALRTGVVLFEVFIALAFPDFGLVVNLIGGSSMCCLSFILPPLMYMKLVNDHSSEEWPKRTTSLWQRTYLYEISLVGIVGGVFSTVASLYALLRPEQFQSSCLVHFGVE